MPLLGIVALACSSSIGGRPAGDAPAETDLAADSGDSDGSGGSACVPQTPSSTVVDLADRADALAALPAGTCASLLDPWSPADPSELPRVAALLYSFPRYAPWDEAKDCPCVSTEDDDYDCVAGDFLLAGHLHCGFGGSGAGGCTSTAFGIADTTGTFGETLADGQWSQSGMESHGLGFRSYKTSRVDNGATTVLIRDGGAGAYHGTLSGTDAYLRVVAAPGVTSGDLCATWSYDVVAACDAEPVGRFAVAGAQALEVRFDGDVDCDGCGELFVDGVAAGEVCGAMPTGRL
jgi:hypothetical protein